MRFSFARRETVNIRPRAWTYGQSVTWKPYFHHLSHSSYFLVIELYFSRNRTDDKFFLSNRGYRASRKLYGGALLPK
jgi:hypothetical protein